MHPTEAELLALIDDELEPGRTEALRAHLVACPACAAEEADLRSLLDRNRASLGSLDRDPRPATADDVLERARRRSAPRKTTNRLLRAAAVAFLVATAAVAAALPGSPVRDAAVRLVEGLRGPTAPEAPAASDSPAVVAVRPGERLVVAFEERQSAGTIDVVLEPTATARVEASGGGVSFSVADDSIAVGNAGASVSYVVTLPAAIASAEVRVGGVTVFRKDGDRVEAAGPVADGRASIPFDSID